jgi:hypothetical protein
MKILAKAGGKTSHGTLIYAIVWKKDVGVFMLRFLDEPFSFDWRVSNEIVKTNLFDLIWCAHNMCDPAFGSAPRARRAEVQDYDYTILAAVYQEFLQQAQGLLSYSKWVDKWWNTNFFTSPSREGPPLLENPGARPDLSLLQRDESDVPYL